MELDDEPIKAKHVKKYSKKDAVLFNIIQYVSNNEWKGISNAQEEKPYIAIGLELSIEEGCLIRRTRVKLHHICVLTE